MAWLSRNDWTNSDKLYSSALNNLANDDRNWGGDVNGGGHHLSNVIIDGAQTPWTADVNAAGFALQNVRELSIVKSSGGVVGPVLTLHNSAGLAEDREAINFQSTGRLRAQILSTAHAADGFAGTLEFCTGLDTQVERMRISGTGNVGIGTGAPGALLTVIPTVNPSTVAAANQLVIGENSNSSAYRLSLGFGTIASYWAGVIDTTQAGGGVNSRLLLNPSGGQVGIGTLAPFAALSIVGGYSEASIGHSALCMFSTSTSGTELTINHSGGAPYSVSLQVRSSSADGIHFPLALNPIGGGVCIGIGAPSSFNHTLTVYHSNLRNICALSDGSEAGIAINNTASGGHNWSLYSSGGATGIGQGCFSIYDDTVSASRLTIKPNGAIGLGGQVNPAYTLDVSGNINCTGGFFLNGTPKMVMTASADDEAVANGQTSVWFDEASNRLTIRYRNAAGVLKAGYIPME